MVEMVNVGLNDCIAVIARPPESTSNVVTCKFNECEARTFIFNLLSLSMVGYQIYTSVW